jgi:hypothetical protein
MTDFTLSRPTNKFKKRRNVLVGPVNITLAPQTDFILVFSTNIVAGVCNQQNSFGRD